MQNLLSFMSCSYNKFLVVVALGNQFSDQSRNQSPQPLWPAVGLLATNRLPKSLRTLGMTLFSDRFLVQHFVSTAFMEIKFGKRFQSQ